MYMYIYIYIYMYMYVYIYIYTYTYAILSYLIRLHAVRLGGDDTEGPMSLVCMYIYIYT